MGVPSYEISKNDFTEKTTKTIFFNETSKFRQNSWSFSNCSDSVMFEAENRLKNQKTERSQFRPEISFLCLLATAEMYAKTLMFTIKIRLLARKPILVPRNQIFKH